jgi:hypothetical protein
LARGGECGRAASGQRRNNCNRREAKQWYDVNLLADSICCYVDNWRNLKTPADWHVTPAAQRLLTHWRTQSFDNQHPFFCLIEAVETMIWLTEAAPGAAHGLLNQMMHSVVLS